MKKATLQDWAEHGWLSPYQPTAQEVANQLREVDRELSDAGQNIPNHRLAPAGYRR